MLSIVPFIVLSGLATPAASPLAEAPAAQVRDAWSVPLGTLRGTALRRMALHGDLLLVEDEGHGLSALHAATGEPRWFVQADDSISHRPAPGDGALALSAGAQLIVAEAGSGRRLLDLRGAALVAASSPATDGELAYLPTLLHDRLVGLSVATGLQAWELRLPSPVATPAQLIGRRGHASVLIGTDDGVLRAVPAGADVPRAERWTLRTGALLGAPVIHGERIYAATRDRVVWAIDAGTGAAVWKQYPGQALTGAPVATSGQVFVGAGERLLALAAADGSIDWELDGALRPVAASEQLLLVRTPDGRASVLAPADGRALATGLPADALVHGDLVLSLLDERHVAARRVVR